MNNEVSSALTCVCVCVCVWGGGGGRNGWKRRGRDALNHTSLHRGTGSVDPVTSRGHVTGVERVKSAGSGHDIPGCLWSAVRVGVARGGGADSAFSILSSPRGLRMQWPEVWLDNFNQDAQWAVDAEALEAAATSQGWGGGRWRPWLFTSNILYCPHGDIYLGPKCSSSCRTAHCPTNNKDISGKSQNDDAEIKWGDYCHQNTHRDSSPKNEYSLFIHSPLSRWSGGGECLSPDCSCGVIKCP